MFTRCILWKHHCLFANAHPEFWRQRQLHTEEFNKKERKKGKEIKSLRKTQLLQRHNNLMNKRITSTNSLLKSRENFVWYIVCVVQICDHTSITIGLQWDVAGSVDIIWLLLSLNNSFWDFSKFFILSYSNVLSFHYQSHPKWSTQHQASCQI